MNISGGSGTNSYLPSSFQQMLSSLSNGQSANIFQTGTGSSSSNIMGLLLGALSSSSSSSPSSSSSLSSSSLIEALLLSYMSSAMQSGSGNTEPSSFYGSNSLGGSLQGGCSGLGGGYGSFGGSSSYGLGNNDGGALAAADLPSGLSQQLQQIGQLNCQQEQLGQIDDLQAATNPEYSEGISTADQELGQDPYTGGIQGYGSSGFNPGGPEIPSGMEGYGSSGFNPGGPEIPSGMEGYGSSGFNPGGPEIPEEGYGDASPLEYEQVEPEQLMGFNGSYGSSNGYPISNTTLGGESY